MTDCITIVTFNRPLYLEKTLAGLKENDLTNIDIHFFQDGAINAFSGIRRGEEEDIRKCILLCEQSNLGEVHIREKNVGLAINQYEALQYALDLYENVLVLEDDVIPCPSAVSAWQKVIKQQELAFLCMRIRPPSRPSKENELLLTREELNFSFFATSKKGWADAKQIFEPAYNKYLKDIDYFQRSHEGILQHHRQIGSKAAGTGQDSIKYSSATKALLPSATFSLPRGKHIGEEGTNVHTVGIHDILSETEIKDYPFDRNSTAYKIIALENPDRYYS